MDIQKLDYIKVFDTELKTQLNVDKKYLPVYKKLAAVLRSVNPMITQVEKTHEETKENYLQTSLSINKSYAEAIENFQKSLKMIVEKNQSEVEKSQKLKVKKTHLLNANLKEELEDIETRLNQLQLDAKAELDSADNTSKRELSMIAKVMADIRKRYTEVCLEIENEKQLSTTQQAELYDRTTLDLDQKFKALDDEKLLKLSVIKEDAQKQNIINDENYLTIKNSYTQLSIALNKKISEIKKKHTSVMATLEKEHQEKMKPILQSIEDLKDSYQEAQKKALQNYTEKMTSLNVIFDVQKSAYEAKKERIIHEGNENITLFNSKLSAYRETIQKEKLITSRKMRDEMKSLETEKEVNKMNTTLTQKLNALDNDLNRQIMRTNKDILNKKRESQRKLYEHDLQHLREINEWRSKKILYEYEKKQESAKIDLNYNHNIKASELSLALEEVHFQYQRDVLNINQNRDLLPLEYQLMIAASIQERELNMLGNDAHFSIATYKHQETLIEDDYKLSQALIQLERDKAKALYYANTQVLNTATQLELEKERIRKDYALNEQELRIELNQSILSRQKEMIETNLRSQTITLEAERETSYLNNKFTLDEIKLEAQTEERKRIFFVNEARYKNQHRLSNEKANRMLSIYQNELEYNQKHTEAFMALNRTLYFNHVAYRDAVSELYHLPSHPEVLKGTITILKRLVIEMSKSMISVLEHFQSVDQEFYIKKIEDLTGYKYMLKHEDTMNYYAQEIQKVEEKKSTILKDIRSLEEQFFQNQTELERNHAFINQLDKITLEIKNNELKSEHKHQDLKENLKLVSNHEHEIKRIKQNLSRIEKSIDEKHRLIVPLDQEVERLTAKQQSSEKELEHHKHEEASVFYRYLNHNQKIYQSYAQDIKNFSDHVIMFFDALSSEVYVTDLFLTDTLKKLNRHFFQYEKIMNHKQQQFLNLMLKFYVMNEREQNLMMRGFKKSTQALILSLNHNYSLQMKSTIQENKKRLKEQNHQTHNLKEKTQKRLELEKVSHNKKLITEHAILKSIEQRITENMNRQSSELKLLNENQISVALQYRHEHEEKVKVLDEAHRKWVFQMDQQKAQAEKNHIQLEESIDTKNQVILARHQALYEKNLLALKQKSDHFEEMIMKATENDQEKRRDHAEVIKRMNIKRESELRNIQIHLKRFTLDTKATQNKVLVKESKVLKKSHHSRVRMLHLT
jgi:golgin subfamily A member 4